MAAAVAARHQLKETLCMIQNVSTALERHFTSAPFKSRASSVAGRRCDVTLSCDRERERERETERRTGGLWAAAAAVISCALLKTDGTRLAPTLVSRNGRYYMPPHPSPPRSPRPSREETTAVMVMIIIDSSLCPSIARWLQSTVVVGQFKFVFSFFFLRLSTQPLVSRCVNPLPLVPKVQG